MSMSIVAGLLIPFLGTTAGAACVFFLNGPRMIKWMQAAEFSIQRLIILPYDNLYRLIRFIFESVIQISPGYTCSCSKRNSTSCIGKQCI